MTAATRRIPSWIKAYLAYTDSSESPLEYHVWSALSTIAGALRRKCFFDMGYFRLYPNLYAVLVGPPGRCKKSTAMRISREMLSGIQGINFTSDSTTRERLIRDMTQSRVDDHSSMTAYSSEFASLLTSSGMDMVVFLTDIYESPNEWSHKTMTGGIQKIIGPYLNLLGATTPDWIARSLPLDTVGIGLTSRIVFVYQDTPRVRPAFPVLTQEQLIVGQLLREELAVISTIQGQYILEPEAKKLYEDWYTGRVEQPNPTGDSRLAGYFERKPMHVLKLCMIIAASKRQELIITSEDLNDSFTLLAETEEKMPKVFAAVGKNSLSLDIQTIEELVMQRGSITKGELMEMYKHNLRSDDLEEVLNVLIMSGKVRVNILPGNIINVERKG